MARICEISTSIQRSLVILLRRATGSDALSWLVCLCQCVDAFRLQYPPQDLSVQGTLSCLRALPIVRRRESDLPFAHLTTSWSPTITYHIFKNCPNPPSSSPHSDFDRKNYLPFSHQRTLLSDIKAADMRLAILSLVLATITVTVVTGSNKRTCNKCHDRIQ